MTLHLAHPVSVKTTCPYCGVGCGLLAAPDGEGGAGIAGDPEHPANFGRTCSKGSALGETLGLKTRLLHPLIGGERVGWARALDTISSRLSDIIAAHGPEAVAFYLSGQLLTEDYYVANKLAKGFIGTPHVDTNSRLCMASSVAGHRRAFGSDTVPGAYQDIEEADLIVLTGSNAAWCHPVLFQRMLAARARRGTRLVVIDPRRTASAEEADLHLAVAPGMDSVLFARLFVELAESEALDRAFMAEHTGGFDAALERAREIAPTREAAAAKADVAPETLATFLNWWRTTERTVTAYSQGVNQSAQGTDKVGAIINCHLATGRIGRPGAGPFSLTGQPNAMGGREVGGLANMLAAHMGFSPPEVDRVRRFWRAPNIVTREGLKAVQMFEAIERGAIKALWVMGTNPAVSLPRADAMRAALGKLDLLVVSENVQANDTADAGNAILLPAAAWGEKDGTVTNSERRISRQRAFLPLAGEAKPDWWALSEIARRLGHGAAFAYASPADIFREHAALSAFENDGTRDFDIGGLAGIDDAGYAALEPVQWPVRASGGDGTARLFAEGGFFTPDRKARFVAPALPALAAPTDAARPLRLNTGRIRDQWHTMTRTGLSPRLGSHRPVPTVEVSPADAARHGLEDGALARIETAHGEAVLEVAITDAQRAGEIFVPIHWSAMNSSGGRTGGLVQPATDPFSGQPEAKATPASITPVAIAARGVAVSRERLAAPGGTWWARLALAGGEAIIVTAHDPAALIGEAERLFPGAELAQVADPALRLHRITAFRDGRFLGALMIGPPEQAPAWDGAAELLLTDLLDAEQRRAAATGSRAGTRPGGRVVCACFGVGIEAIRAAIRDGAGDPAAIGAALKAGTNCGSCIPELKQILAAEAGHVPA